jgi:hypothetical protein
VLTFDTFKFFQGKLNLTLIYFLAKAYVPPHLRGTNNVASFKTKLHEDDEKPDKNLKAKSNQPGVEDTEKKIKNIKKV